MKKKTKFQAYRDRQEGSGLKQVSVWVPAGDVEALKKYAARKRKAFEKEQANG